MDLRPGMFIACGAVAALSVSRIWRTRCWFGTLSFEASPVAANCRNGLDRNAPDHARLRKRSPDARQPVLDARHAGAKRHSAGWPAARGETADPFSEPSLIGNRAARSRTDRYAVGAGFNPPSLNKHGPRCCTQIVKKAAGLTPFSPTAYLRVTGPASMSDVPLEHAHDGFGSFWIEPPADSSPVMSAVPPIATEFCAPQRMGGQCHKRL
jgi:hypothetical protein